jgi:hypothetical protein
VGQERLIAVAQKNAPHSSVIVFGRPLMLLEAPNEFNQALDAFLAKLE